MDNLTSLNTRGSTLVAYTENRPNNVIFSYPNAVDIESSIIGIYVFPVEKTIDIIEIIDAPVANISYSIDVSSITGASVAWTTQPPGKTTSEINGVYTISRIDTVAEWDAVATPEITIPNNFNGSISYTATITYTDSAGIQTKSWTVGKNIPITSADAEFTLSCDADHLKGPGELTFPVYADMVGIGADLILLGGSSYYVDGYIDSGYFAVEAESYDSAFSLTCDAIAYDGSNVELFSNFSISFLSNVEKPTGATMNTSATLTCDAIAQPVYSAFLHNGDITEFYYKDQRSELFASGLTVINPLSPAPVTTYKIVFTLTSYTHGYIQNRTTADTLDNSLETTITIEGSESHVNSEFAKGLFFYPYYNNTSNQDINIKSYIDGTLLKDTTHTLTSFVSTPAQPTTNTEKIGNFILHPDNEQFLYCKMSAVVIGGGGGNCLWEGGAGAVAKSVTNYDLDNLDSGGLVFQQGAGGAGSITGSGSDGGNSRLIGGSTTVLVTSTGGEGGNSSGGGGDNSDFIGGTRSTYIDGGTTYYSGGGGAGSGGNAQQGSHTTGGNGGVGTDLTTLGIFTNTSTFLYTTVGIGGPGSWSNDFGFPSGTQYPTTPGNPGSGGPGANGATFGSTLVGTPQAGSDGALYLKIEYKG
jgi:hypothetical protein